MSIGQYGTPEERKLVLDQFKAGRSKSRIAKALGCDKARVGRMLAQAIRELQR